MTDLARSDFFYDITPAFFPLYYVEDTPRDKRPGELAEHWPDARTGNTIPSRQARQVFGTNLRRARRLANLSQQQFAALAGISRSYVGELEHAHHNISINRMECLAAVLGLELRALLDPALYTPGPARQDN